MKYKCKETGNTKNIQEIKKEFLDLISNSNEFNEYTYFDKYLEKYYISEEVEE
jgi:hypothetical protein